MRILLLVQNYFPKTQSCAALMHDLALSLIERGHEVVLVAPDDELEAKRSITVEEGVTVVRVRAGRFRGVPRPLRAINEWLLSPLIWLRAKDVLRQRPCELIVSYSPTIFFGPLVGRLRRLWGCPSYLVLRDLFPEWSVDAGLIRRNGLIHRFFRHYELRLYDEADTIGVQSRRNLAYFEQPALIGRYRLEVLHNWAVGDDVLRTPTKFRRRLGLDGKIVFFYGGNLGVAQDLDGLLRLAERLSDRPEVRFLFVGDGSERARLAGSVRRQGLENVLFMPPESRESYLGMVSEFDVGLISLRRDLKTHNFPGKMLDYMRFSMPILASINPGNDLGELLEEHEAGVACVNGDDEALYRGACALLADGERRRRLGANGRELFDELFSAERAAGQILAAAGRGLP